MPNIINTEVTGLVTSIVRSGYSMISKPPTEKEFSMERREVEQAISNYNYVKRHQHEDASIASSADDFLYNNKHIKRAIRLANEGVPGTEQFLTGITVYFDLTASIKAWVQIERYKYMNFVSSMSTMHRAMNIDILKSCNGYVYGNQIATAQKLQERYNSLLASAETNDGDAETLKKDAYLEMLYNLPLGYELTAGMVTNYRCLANVYRQRRHHRLPDWQYICDWIETLPLSDYLITGKAKSSHSSEV